MQGSGSSMKNFKPLLFFSLLLAGAVTVFSGPYPGTLTQHTHSSSAQGGVIGNFQATNKISVGNSTMTSTGISATSMTATTGVFTTLSATSFNLSTASLAGTLLLKDGAASSLAAAFNNQTNLGLFRAASNQLAFVSNGTTICYVSASQFVMQPNTQFVFDNGTAANPPFVFRGDAGGASGLYGLGTNQYGIAAAGIAIGSFTSSGISMLNGKYLIQGNPMTTIVTSSFVHTLGGCTTNNTSYQDCSTGGTVPGYFITITPKFANSRIKLHFQTTLTKTATGTGQISIFRGLTNLAGSANAYFYSVAPSTSGLALSYPASILWEDQPLTTGATTYTIQIKSSDANNILLNSSAARSTFWAEEYVP